MVKGTSWILEFACPLQAGNLEFGSLSFQVVKVLRLHYGNGKVYLLDLGICLPAAGGEFGIWIFKLSSC